jgi:hypothetical protein
MVIGSAIAFTRSDKQEITGSKVRYCMNRPDIWGMDVFLDTFRLVFPSLLILIAVYLMMSNYFDNEDKRRKAEYDSRCFWSALAPVHFWSA